MVGLAFFWTCASLLAPVTIIYVDDYGTFGGCKAAIDEYRAKHKITAPLHYIREDPTLNTRLFGYAQKDQRKDVFEAVWWQKE